MTSFDPPSRKRSGEAPPRSPAASLKPEETEHPFNHSSDVNTPRALAWDGGLPTVPVPFDWPAVEASVDDPAADMFPADLTSRYPELAAFMREVVCVSDASGALPTPKQVAVAWIALCFTLRLSFVENLSVRACAEQLGVSHEVFFRRVKRWCGILNVPPPGAKPADTGEKVAAKLGVSRRHVTNLRQRRVIPFYRLGPAIRVSPEDVSEALRHICVEARA